MQPRIEFWHIYKCLDCNLSEDKKLKFVVAICRHKEKIWGFFINTPRSRFILANPELEKEQVRIYKNDYRFLDHDSDIGCDSIKEFYPWELKPHVHSLLPATKEAILKTVENSDALSPEVSRIILSNK